MEIIITLLFFFAAICFTIFMVSFLLKEYDIGTIALLTACVAIFVAFIIKRYDDKAPKTHVIENVVEYKIDSVININVTDTSKVYTITYIK